MSSNKELIKKSVEIQKEIVAKAALSALGGGMESINSLGLFDDFLKSVTHEMELKGKSEIANNAGLKFSANSDLFSEHILKIFKTRVVRLITANMIISEMVWRMEESMVPPSDIDRYIESYLLEEKGSEKIENKYTSISTKKDALKMSLKVTELSYDDYIDYSNTML